MSSLSGVKQNDSIKFFMERTAFLSSICILNKCKRWWLCLYTTRQCIFTYVLSDLDWALTRENKLKKVVQILVPISHDWNNEILHLFVSASLAQLKWRPRQELYHRQRSKKKWKQMSQNSKKYFEHCKRVNFTVRGQCNIIMPIQRKTSCLETTTNCLTLIDIHIYIT